MSDTPETVKIAGRAVRLDLVRSKYVDPQLFDTADGWITARAAFDALAAEGYVIVPRSPSPEMVERIGIQFEHERDAHDTCAEAARRLWAAALSAGGDDG
jgi:hypothetical protein